MTDMWRLIGVVFAKEALDNARDRRSLLMALFYPLMGPLLLGLLVLAVVGVVSDTAVQQEELAITGIDNAPALAAFLERRGVRVAPVAGDVETAVRKGAVEVVVVVPEGFDAAFSAQRTASLSVVVNSSRLPGLLALNRTAGLLGDFNLEVWGERISARGVDHRVLQPIAINSVNVAAGEHIAEFLLFMVPPLLIFNLFMGGVYMAIDTTSGERERGSMEPLLINPIERWALLLGKYMAALLYTGVAVAVQLAAFLSVFAMVGRPEISFIESFDLPAAAGIFLISVPLMMVAVAIQVIIATVTRSLKEAQTYLGLLPLVPAIPGMVMVFAPVQAKAWMMLIPVFSQTLLLGQAVRGEAVALADVAVSVSSSVLVAMALIAVAARLYEREDLIFGS